MAKLVVNPEAVGGMGGTLQNVAVIIAPEDVMKAKPKVVRVGKDPVEVDDKTAAELRKEKAVDKDGKEIPAVVDYKEAAPTSGDMKASDLEAGGKKAATK